MQQRTNPSGGQLVVLVQGMPIDTEIGFRNMKTRFARQLIILGVAQIVIGTLCIIFQIVIYGVDKSFYRLTGDGISTGALFIVTGAFGIRGGKKKGRFQVVTFNVLSILSAVYAAFLLSVAMPHAIKGSNPNYYYISYPRETLLAMDVLLTILSILEGIVAICSSVVCCYIGACFDDCGSGCCCPTEPQYNQLVSTNQPLSAQQQSTISNQQQRMVNFNQQPVMLNPNQQPSILNPNQQPAMLNLNQQPALINPNQQPVLINPNQQPAILNPSQQPAMINPNLQPATFNPNQQLPIFFAHQPMVGFNSQQYAVQYFPHQLNALLIPHQPAFSAPSTDATGQGLQYAVLATAPPPDERETEESGKEICAGSNLFDDPELYARAYDDDSEYHY